MKKKHQTRTSQVFVTLVSQSVRFRIAERDGSVDKKSIMVCASVSSGTQEHQGGIRTDVRLIIIPQSVLTFEKNDENPYVFISGCSNIDLGDGKPLRRCPSIAMSLSPIACEHCYSIDMCCN